MVGIGCDCYNSSLWYQFFVWRLPYRDENFLVVEDQLCCSQWYFVYLCGVSCETLAVVEIP